MAAADALVSKVVDILASITQQESGLFAGVEREVEKLTSNLQSIQAVLADAETVQLKEETIRLWLERLKRVTYDIDNVLDEWSYELLKSKFATKKVWPFSFLSCFCFPKKVPLRRRVAVKISDLNAWLDVITIERDRFGFQIFWRDAEQVEQNPQSLLTSVVHLSEVKGREIEREKLVNLLLAESNELPKLHPISVVGTGGIGKTTLAKLVYNDETVVAHFDIRIWVCVSEPFDKIRIAKEVLKSLIGHAANLVKLKSIAVKIMESVKGKKFLLVLDDVWNEDPKEWKELEDFLTGGSSGSKILVTTCKEKVAKLMGCRDVDIFRVGILSKEESWSLLCEIAFDGLSNQQRGSLDSVGREIVASCKGLPLAVRTIACLLRRKKSTMEWDDFLVWLGKLEIFDPLWLSYYHLPSSLKQCFLYCAIFPKGYRMSKDELVGLWVAHGFVEPTEDRDMEMVGHDYFHNLGMRYLFQEFEVEEKFNRLDKIYFKLHDEVHKFAKHLMTKECLYVDVSSAEDVTSSVDAAYGDGLYHLHVKLGEKVKFLDSFYNLRNLRSLFVLPPNKDSLVGAALPEIFNQLTCLRSLSLSRCRLENIPSNINKLIHLRWLKLSKNYTLKELPATICEMYNLQTLSVNWCDGLTHFPQGVEKLINLRHLNNNYTYFPLPKGITKLSALVKLPRITIDPKFKDAFNLRDLENLNNISGSLTIFFMGRERKTLVKDAKKAQLEEKKHITTLSLNFPEREAEEWMQQEDEELVEALKPPSSLEMLRITCYKGANFPSWVNALTSLKKLKLWYWSNCETLPALAELPCLEYVEFNSFGRVAKVAAEFYQSSSSTAPLFPKLKNLQFMNMTEWEEWSDYEGDEEVMPCLSYLTIENCPKLRQLPNFIHQKAALHKQISYR